MGQCHLTCATRHSHRHHACTVDLTGGGWCYWYPYTLQGGQSEEDCRESHGGVSSTVIPLEDLPEQEVGFGFGFSKEDKGKKPAYLKDIKLITSKNKHRFVAPAGVKQLTKEQWEAFSNSVAA